MMDRAMELRKEAKTLGTLVNDCSRRLRNKEFNGKSEMLQLKHERIKSIHFQEKANRSAYSLILKYHTNWKKTGVIDLQFFLFPKEATEAILEFLQYHKKNNDFQEYKCLVIKGAGQKIQHINKEEESSSITIIAPEIDNVLRNQQYWFDYYFVKDNDGISVIQIHPKAQSK